MNRRCASECSLSELPTVNCELLAPGAVHTLYMDTGKVRIKVRLSCLHKWKSIHAYTAVMLDSARVYAASLINRVIGVC